MNEQMNEGHPSYPCPLVSWVVPRSRKEVAMWVLHRWVPGELGSPDSPKAGLRLAVALL